MTEELTDERKKELDHRLEEEVQELPLIRKRKIKVEEEIPPSPPQEIKKSMLDQAVEMGQGLLLMILMQLVLGFIFNLIAAIFNPQKEVLPEPPQHEEEKVVSLLEREPEPPGLRDL